MKNKTIVELREKEKRNRDELVKAKINYNRLKPVV